MLRRAWGWPARYGIAVVFTVFVAALKFAVPAFGAQGPDLFLTVPVAASAVFGGFGPALLATVGATIIAAYFTPPAGLVVPWDANGLDVVGFFFEGLIVAVLGAGARAALGRTLDTLHRSEELERERSALIETVNHELRNPLASLSGHLQLASRYAARDDRPDRGLDRRRSRAWKRDRSRTRSGTGDPGSRSRADLRALHPRIGGGQRAWERYRPLSEQRARRAYGRTSLPRGDLERR